jgi:hypothetical protein
MCISRTNVPLSLDLIEVVRRLVRKAAFQSRDADSHERLLTLGSRYAHPGTCKPVGKGSGKLPN